MIQALGECRGLAHPEAFSGNQDRLEEAAGRLQGDNQAQAAPSAGGAPVSQPIILHLSSSPLSTDRQSCSRPVLCARNPLADKTDQMPVLVELTF